MAYSKCRECGKHIKAKYAYSSGLCYNCYKNSNKTSIEWKNKKEYKSAQYLHKNVSVRSKNTKNREYPSSTIKSKTHNEEPNQSSKLREGIVKMGNNIRLRHKILILIIIINLILIGFFPVLFVFDIIYIVGYIHGWMQSCPNCKCFFAKKKFQTENVGSRDTYKTVIRTMKHKNANGELTGTSSYNEKVPITITTLRHHYKCKHCDHTWHGEQTVEE